MGELVYLRAVLTAAKHNNVSIREIHALQRAHGSRSMAIFRCPRVALSAKRDSFPVKDSAVPKAWSIRSRGRSESKANSNDMRVAIPVSFDGSAARETTSR